MTKAYEIFKDDVFNIQICEKIKKTFARQLEECEFYQFFRRKNIKRQAEKEETIINNRKLNLVRKIRFLSFEDFLDIIESADMIQNYYFVIDGNDVLVTIDQENKKCIGVICSNEEIQKDTLELYNGSSVDIVTREIGEQISLSEIKSINRGVYLNNLIEYGDENVFDSFIDAYIDLVSEKIK